MEDDDVLIVCTVSEAARLIQTSDFVVRDRIYRGRLAATQAGPRQPWIVYLPRSAVDPRLLAGRRWRTVARDAPGVPPIPPDEFSGSRAAPEDRATDPAGTE